MEQSSLAYILDLQIAVVIRYIYIFAFFRYVFRRKVGYFFLSKGAKFPGIFSSSTKTTELTQSRYRASLFRSLFLAIACTIDIILSNIAKLFQAWF